MDCSMFSTYSSRVAELLQKIESGEIALPDLQRPFVWEDATITMPNLDLLPLPSPALDLSEVF